jgi:4-aminobutyrate aminotransferase-like enzyme
VAHLSRTNIPATGDGSHVAHVPAPDSYRGADPVAFAAAVQAAIARLDAAGHGLAAIILCPAFVNEGFPSLPPGWLDAALTHVRAAGGIVIADEVQPGFGRVGTHFWGHLRAGFAPDVVTMGKPMGNGHPVAGVAARPDVMAAFRGAYRYFNTFGGNPVSVAAASAVLDVIADEGLQANAARMEGAARDGLRALAARHAGIGDVRATGMIFGAELVTDQAAKTPAPRHAARVVNALCRRGILLSRLGIHANTLKIRPPLPFGPDNLDQLLTALDAVLTDLGDPRD